jgi:hypothetical protein
MYGGGMKKCTRCGKMKEISKKKNGDHYKQCKECREYSNKFTAKRNSTEKYKSYKKKYDSDYLVKNKERLKKYHDEYYQQNKIKWTKEYMCSKDIKIQQEKIDKQKRLDRKKDRRELRPWYITKLLQKLLLWLKNNESTYLPLPAGEFTPG